MSTSTCRERVWRPSWPASLHTMRALRRGPGDPTYRIDEAGRHWRGIGTPEGPATLVLHARNDLGEIHAQAWGPGADWALASVPDLLGDSDDWRGFEPRHPVLADVWHRHPHVRLGRTGLVMESLLPAVLEQKVTGQEAFAGFRMLVQRYGEPAPGPGADRRLRVQPTAEALRRVPSWAWLQMHVDGARSRAVVSAARVADSLERTVGLPGDEVDRRLRTLPGIGVWTSAEVRQRAHGDPDAVSYGDYHVAKDIGWALTGTPFDDAELEAFLEPWRPHRGRVQLLVVVGGLHRPRRGPRMAPRTHLPAQVRRR